MLKPEPGVGWCFVLCKHTGGQPTSGRVLPPARRDEASNFGFLKAKILTEAMHGAALKCPSVPDEDFTPKL